MKKVIVSIIGLGMLLCAQNVFALTWSCHVHTSSGQKSLTVDEPTGDAARSEARRKVKEWYPETTIYRVNCS